MSFLNGVHRITNVTPLPAATTTAADGTAKKVSGRRVAAAAVAALHDHEFFLRCDPHYSSHKALAPDSRATTEAGARKAHSLPAHVTPLSAAANPPLVKVYEVLDVVPNPVYSANVVCKVEAADFPAGIFTRIRSAMGVVFETTWGVRPRGSTGDAAWGLVGGAKEGGEEEEDDDDDGTEYELVQQAVITCSKLILGFVKTQVEANRGGIHKKVIARLAEDLDHAGFKADEAAIQNVVTVGVPAS